MNLNTKVQLSAMMFLNFFIWGIWFVTMGTYIGKGAIGADGGQTGLAYGTQCLGAIIAPFIVGMIADRFFAAQKILGVLHLAGAVLLYFVAEQTTFGSFYSLLLTYMIIYMPTLALVNAIALKQVTNAEKEFGGIRVWGTIGWIVSGLIIGWMAWEKNPADLGITFKVGAIVSAAFGAYSFFLPNTPPPKAGKDVSFREVVGLDALNMLKDKNYLLFFIASILICIPLAFYYGNANQFLNEVGVSGAAGKMSMGQMSETLFLFLLPLFFKRFSIKQMLFFGMIAWVLRYALFAYGNVDSGLWMLYLGIILHGICYDFFFVTGQIYTDQTANDNVRSSAQGLITLATYGIGMYIGFYMAGEYVDQNQFRTGAKSANIQAKDILTEINGKEIKNIVSVKEFMANYKPADKINVTVIRDKISTKKELIVNNFSSNYSNKVTNNALQKLGIETDSTENSKLTSGVFVKNLSVTHNWQAIWLLPCLFAAGVALLFFVFFKNNKKAITE